MAKDYSNDYRYALCALNPSPDGDHEKLICVPYGTIIRKLPDNKVMIKYPKDGLSQTRKRPRRDPHSDDLITIKADLILVANYFECQEKLAVMSKNQKTAEMRKSGQKSTRAEADMETMDTDDDDDDVVFVSVTPSSPSHHQADESCQTCHRALKAEVGVTPGKNVTFPPGIQVTVTSRNQRAASTSAAVQDPETLRQSNEHSSERGEGNQGEENQGEENEGRDNQGTVDQSQTAFTKNISYFFDNLEIMIKRWSQDVYELKTECLNRFAEDMPEGVENEVQNDNERENTVVKESVPIRPKPIGKQKTKGEPTTPKRRYSVKVPLPPEYDENDPRWTLRYPQPGPGLMELPEHSGVYIKTSNVFSFGSANDRKSFARCLLQEIFNDEALKRCSYPGRRSMVNEHRRTLDKHAMTVLLETVAKFGDLRGWTPVEEHIIVSCLRSKLHKYYKQAEEARIA